MKASPRDREPFDFSPHAEAKSRTAQRLIWGRHLDMETQQLEGPDRAEYYCPACARAADDPLVCGDCAAVICRVCGTPLERVDELGIG